MKHDPAISMLAVSSPSDYATIITAVAAIVAAGLGYVNHRKIAEVHVLVNSRLSETLTSLSLALREVETLKRDVAAKSEGAEASNDPEVRALDDVG